MAQIKVVGKSLTLTSTATYADIKNAEKRYPEALVLSEIDEKTGEVTETFRAAICARGDIGVGVAAVGFDNASKDGFARVSILINAPEKDVETYVKDTYGKTLTALNQWEKAFAGSKQSFEEAYAELSKSISVE